MHGGSGTLSAYILYIYMNIIIRGSMVIETFEESQPQHMVRGSPIERHTRPLTLNRLNYSYDLRKLSNTLTTSS
jgi:phage protein U